MTPVLRVARPSDDLDALLPFWRDGLGLSVLSRFADHDGFDGLVLGRPEAGWHVEFTRAHGHKAGRAPSKDHLLTLYLPDRAAWQGAMDRMVSAGHTPVPSFNPYWDRHGMTFEDPDGYRVVLWHGAWSV